MVLNSKGFLILNIPDQEALVICLAVVLLDGWPAVTDGPGLVENLIGFMNITKQGIIKLLKNFDVVIAVIHDPAHVSLAVIDCSVIEGNVNSISIGGVLPVCFVKDWQNVKGQVIF